MNIFPGILELENYDYFPISAGGGEGKTFHDLSKGNDGGAYRSDGDVDIEVSPERRSYNLTDLEPGEWVNYTVFIPENGPYEITVEYAAGNGNGKIKFSFDGGRIKPVKYPFLSETRIPPDGRIGRTLQLPGKWIFLNAGVQR